MSRTLCEHIPQPLEPRIIGMPHAHGSKATHDRTQYARTMDLVKQPSLSAVSYGKASEMYGVIFLYTVMAAISRKFVKPS